jgi:hypothetical protein
MPVLHGVSGHVGTMAQHIAPPTQVDPLLQAANAMNNIMASKIKTVHEREELTTDLQVWLNKLRRFEEEQATRNFVRASGPIHGVLR